MITNIGHSYCQVNDEYGWNNSLIKIAGTTCFRSEQKTKKTPDEFVKLFAELNHSTPLEFVWYPFRIRTIGPNNRKLEDDLYSWFNQQRYLRATIDEKGLIVSGNGRAWKEYFVKNYNFEYSLPILQRLKLINKSLFVDFEGGTSHPEIRAIDLKEKSVRNLSWEHRKVHDWVFVKMFDVSIGITREMNRHRVNSVNEMSTRYVSLTDFNMTFNLDAIDDNDTLLLDAWLHHTQSLYAYFINKKYKRDVVRNLLPLGTNVEIVHAARLEDWERFFVQRADNEKAHDEVKIITKKIKEEFEVRKLIEC